MHEADTGCFEDDLAPAVGQAGVVVDDGELRRLALGRRLGETLLHRALRGADADLAAADSFEQSGRVALAKRRDAMLLDVAVAA